MKIKPTFLSHFDSDILVKCPRCSECSHLLKLTEPKGHRLVCSFCAYTKEWILEPGICIPVPGTGPKLFGFELDLWLQTACCGETLWVYNAEHIHFLEDFVEAKLRERKPHPKWGWCNASMESRLPQWIRSSKNRIALLKGLKILRKRILVSA